MEYYLLKASICEKNDTPMSAPKLNRIFLEMEPAIHSTKEIICTILVDMTPEENILQARFKRRKEPRRRHKGKKVPSNSQVQKSFEEIKEKERESKGSIDSKTSINLDGFEMGDEGILTDLYSKTLRKWLEFGAEIKTPSIRKTIVELTSQHLLNITIKELQNLIIQLTHDIVKIFTLELNDDNDEEIYVPYVYSHCSKRCLVIARHFEQWKCCSFYNGSIDFPDLLNPNTLKHVQKFVPIIINDNIFIPRQKILWGLIETDNVSNLFFCNRP